MGRSIDACRLVMSIIEVNDGYLGVFFIILCKFKVFNYKILKVSD